MSEAEDIKEVVRILGKIPPKNLRIVELLNQIPIKNGELDIDVITKLGSEIEDAKKEAEAYRHATDRAMRAIMDIQAQSVAQMRPLREADILAGTQF